MSAVSFANPFVKPSCATKSARRLKREKAALRALVEGTELAEIGSPRETAVARSEARQAA